MRDGRRRRISSNFDQQHGGIRMTKKIVLTIAMASFALAPGWAGARDGKAVYDGSCQACHVVGVAGAPKFGDKTAWADRVGKGVAALVATVKTGKGAMPPKGACADCTDEELEAGVQYMLDAVK
jgi:cytochrome c5